MVEVKSLRKSYEDVVAVADVSFVAGKGVTVLIGPNGAGKTTTLKCIAGIVRPDGGKISIFGKKISEVKDDIFLLPEDRKVFRKLRISDYEKLLSLIYPNWDTKLFGKLLAHFSIPRNRKMEELSAGMKTQLLMAVAYSSGANLVLLDEPTQHLDPVKVNEIETMIRHMGEERVVIVSSHHLEEVEYFSDEFVLINEGRVIYADSIDGAKEKHRVVPQDTVTDEDEIIGLLEGGILVRTEEEKGRHPRLREIVLAYLSRGKKTLEPFFEI